MAQELAGKTALVTGASRGIGEAIARRLAEDGASLALAARSTAALEKLSLDIGGKALVGAGDLAAPGAAAALAAATMERFGSIDIIVANAGTTKHGDFLELSDADWQDGFGLKFFAHMRLIRAAWPALQRSGGSVVIIGGYVGRTPGPESAIAGSVNGALLSFSKALSERGIRDGVQVNAINPGQIRTDRFSERLQHLMKEQGLDEEEATRRLVGKTGGKRVGEPQEVAELVRFIVGPHGRYLQGAAIDLDGGMTKTI